MKIFLSGHYSNDFLKEIAGIFMFDRLEKVCKIKTFDAFRGVMQN